MFKLDSEAAVLDTFRPKDRKHVQLSPDQKFPVIIRHYLAWVHPAGGKVYLVFAVPGGAPTGIVFDGNGGDGPGVPHMCDWCHSMGTGNQIEMLTARLNAKKKLGVNVCSDLSCKDKLEDQANRNGISAIPLLEHLVLRMGRFASEGLKIDLSGAGR